MPRLMRYAFRPPENCKFCENVDKVDRISGITPMEFERKYAYSARPVIVEDATRNWTALEVNSSKLLSKNLNLKIYFRIAEIQLFLFPRCL